MINCDHHLIVNLQRGAHAVKREYDLYHHLRFLLYHYPSISSSHHFVYYSNNQYYHQMLPCERCYNQNCYNCYNQISPWEHLKIRIVIIVTIKGHLVNLSLPNNSVLWIVHWIGAVIHSRRKTLNALINS